MKRMAAKEPMIHIVRRDDLPLWKSWLIRLVFTVASIGVCLLIINIMTGASPAAVGRETWKGAFGSGIFSRSMWTTVRDTCLLLMVAMALTLAFRMRFWNIGGEGQILVGGLVSAILMLFVAGKVPDWMLFVLMIGASVVAGAIWALVPAVFKAVFNTNETLFTLMMNYIAIQVVSYCDTIWEKKKGAGTIGVINAMESDHPMAGWLPTEWFSGAIGTRNYVIVLAVALLLAIALALYIRSTKHGYEIQVVGESENTARYAGINVKKVILRTMTLSGMLCGLVGFLLVSGSSHTITVDTADGRGFTAIIVAWLGQFNVFYMALVAFMLVFFDIGAREIATNFALNESMSDVLVGIVLFFILASSFFVNYRLVIKSRGSIKAGEGIK